MIKSSEMASIGGRARPRISLGLNDNKRLELQSPLVHVHCVKRALALDHFTPAW